MNNILSFLYNALIEICGSDYFLRWWWILMAFAGLFGVVAIIKRITGWRSFNV